jgi:hypothetical protein
MQGRGRGGGDRDGGNWPSTMPRLGRGSPGAQAAQQASQAQVEAARPWSGSLQLPGEGSGATTTININVQCNGGGGGGGRPGCGFGEGYGGAAAAAWAPTLPGLWPLPPLSYAGGAGPGFVYGCPSGPLLLPPLAAVPLPALGCGW